MSVIIDDAKNIGSHVVALNNFMTLLNKESRQTFNPNLDSILEIVKEMKQHASEIETWIKEKKGFNNNGIVKN